MVTFKDQVNGFPLGQVIVITILKLTEPIAFSSVFPYVYFMIKDFGVTKDESEISTFAGYLAAIFALGQVISAIFWGKLSDIYGRKLVLIWGTVGNLVALFFFGFSTTFKLAFLARLLMGIMNGNSAVARCIIGEAAPNKHHQSIAFLAMPIAWNIGCVFGSYIGGSYSHPHRDAGLSHFDSTYPYALPNIIVSIITLFGAFLTWLFLKETHPELQYERDPGIEMGNKILKMFGIPQIQLGPPSIITRQDVLDVSETTSLFSVDSKDISVLITEDISWSLILVPRVMNPIISYFIMQAHFVAFNEFLPIFVSYPLAYSPEGERISQFPLKLVGGLGYTAEMSGKLLSGSGLFGIFAVLIIFPWLDRTIDRNTHFRVSLGLFPILFIILPYVLILTPQKVDSTEYISTQVADIFLYVYSLIRVIIASSMGTLVMILINNNTVAKYSGIINGLAVSSASLASCVSPIVCGYLMTIGQDYGIGWLGWWSISLITIVGFIQSLYIDVE